MQGVNSIPATVFLHLNTFAVVDLVLLRNVITTLALLTSQSDLDSLFVLCHLFALSL